MLKKIEIRRFSFYIFLFVFILSIFILYNDIHSHKTDSIKIFDKILEITKIEKKSSNTIIFCNNYIINQNNSDYKIGDIIKVSGLVKDILFEDNLQYALYLKSKGYDYKIDYPQIKYIGYKNSLKRYINIFRNNIISTIDYIYTDNNHIIRALMVSDRTFITKEHTSLFTNSGISHIISISGFHVVLISGIFFNILFFLPKKYRYIISCIITLFYVIITGFNPPCVRAYIFYITYIYSILYQKRYDIFSIGFLLASFYMAINPYILFDLGFCLSFMSVFSIAMFYKYINNYIKYYLSKYTSPNVIVDSVLSMVCVTLSANILTLPFVYYKIGIVSTIFIFSNIISVPLISMSYPFIILSLLFAKIPFLSDIFSNIVNCLMYLFFKSNILLTSIPYSHLEFKNRSILFTILIYVIIFSIYSIFIKKIIIKNKF